MCLEENFTVPSCFTFSVGPLKWGLLRACSISQPFCSRKHTEGQKAFTSLIFHLRQALQQGSKTAVPHALRYRAPRRVMRAVVPDKKCTFNPGEKIGTIIFPLEPIQDEPRLMGQRLEVLALKLLIFLYTPVFFFFLSLCFSAPGHD